MENIVGKTVLESSKQRTESQTAALASIGIAETGAKTAAGFALGTLAYQDVTSQAVGERRMAWEKLPPTLGMLEELRDRASGLDRRFKDVPLADIRASGQTGQLALPGDDKTTILSGTSDAFSHLGSFYGTPGLSSYLPAADSRVKSFLLAHHGEAERALYAAKLAQYEADKGTKDVRRPEPRIVRAAHRESLDGKGRSAYRITSTRYQPFEVIDLCKALLGNQDVCSALAGSRGRVRWDGRRATVDVIWHADEKLFAGLGDFASGDHFQYAQRFSLDEVRGASTAHKSFAYRNECLNMAIIGKYTEAGESWRHTTSVEAVIAALLARVRTHRAAVESFVGTWVAARRDRIMDLSDNDPERMFKALLVEGLIDMPGLRSLDAKTEALVTAWSKEPGQSLADVVNAATRAAHEGDWWNSVEAEEEAEVQGGNLLYVKNLRAKVQNGLATLAELEGEGATATGPQISGRQLDLD